MCTVTIIPVEGGISVMVNRDEQRSRAPAEPPRWALGGGTRAIWPLDPRGGGTWIAASESGLVVGTLNRAWPANASAGVRAKPSRGALALLAVQAGDADAAVSAIERNEPRRWDGFELFAVGRDAVVHRLLWDGQRLERFAPRRAPLCITSSSLGRHVEAARYELFETMFAEAPADLASAQERFHRHRWPEHPERSVLMSRPDARTQSITRITARDRQEPVMRYEAIDPD